MDRPVRPGGTDEDGQGVDPGFLEVLLADTTDLAAVVEPDGRLGYLNRAGRRMLLLEPGVAPSATSLHDLVGTSDADRLDGEVVAALATAFRWTGSLTLRTAAGTEVPTRSTFRAHSDAQGAHRLTWVARDISTERAVSEHLHRKIFEDELTGLPHRSIFLDRLDMALRRRHADAPPVALLFLSLDRFKEKNDRFGREVGDLLLEAVARRLERLRAEDDMVSRWGGDEFVLMRENAVRGADEAVDLASAVREALAAGFRVDDTDLYVSASIGVAAAAPAELTTDDLLRQAEAAGQMAKRGGGGRVHLYDDEMRARALRRAEIEDALRGAVRRDEVVLHFQPQVSLRSDEIVAVEALLRWHHPEWGLVAPGEFIPVAEASDLILELGGWALRAAMAQAARWRTRFADRAPTLGVNISARQFAQDDFVELVARTLDESGAQPTDICLEITEGILMDDVGATRATLQRLEVLGVQLAVDDFGTGYSSLSYLRTFPVDVLKVDQSFVRGLGHDPEDSAIVQAVVHMGRALKLTTVAEGVETAHQLIELRELDCDLGQGYHFARPRPAEAVTRMIEAGLDWLSIA